MNSVVENILDTLDRCGGEMYGNEPVTQLQHALQCATLAIQDKADDSLIVAALLHDYGHLLSEDDAAAASRGVDLVHEEVGANYLERWFDSAIVQPIRFHVPAKRYLCAVDDNYLGTLSPASVQSLEVQGGPFTSQAAEDFISLPFARNAVRLRIWDDLAKDPEAVIVPLPAFRERLERVLAVNKSTESNSH